MACSTSSGKASWSVGIARCPSVCLCLSFYASVQVTAPFCICPCGCFSSYAHFTWMQQPWCRYRLHALSRSLLSTAVLLATNYSVRPAACAVHGRLLMVRCCRAVVLCIQEQADWCHALYTAVVQVQDEAAGLVVALLDSRPGEAILDACAAPGGKALYAAARMQGQVSICDDSCAKTVPLIRCPGACHKYSQMPRGLPENLDQSH